MEVNLQEPYPYPAQRALELNLQELALTLIAALAAVALAQPAVLLGALAPATWWWLQRAPRYAPPPTWLRWVCAITVAAPLTTAHVLIVPAWAARNVIAAIGPGLASPTHPGVAALCVEALAGPLWFELVVLAARLRSRRIGAAVVRDHRRGERRHRALTRGGGDALRPTVVRRAEIDSEHPPGSIRLGLDRETRRPFDLKLDELASHIFLPGTSGSGKTTTLTRIADGALGAGYGLVVVDCKGGGLGGAARRLAERHRLPFNLVDPDALEDSEPGALGYNPCWGDAAAVANKLVGAFTFSPNADVYKNVALEVTPLIVRALVAAGDEVTLDAIYRTLAKGGMANLAHRVDQPLRGELEMLDRAGGVGSAGYVGFQRRLGALRQGKFGELFRTKPALDWESVLATPSVTYLALQATASSEDVELFARLIAQDLKQVCARRFRELERGGDPLPVMAIFDEFAALREAVQLVDLLLQARQARMPTLVSAQFLPQTPEIRSAVMGAGLLIAHSVAGDDVEPVSSAFGTRSATEVTSQVDYETGFSEKGSIRPVDRFIVHPNQLRNMPVGVAAVRAVRTGRNAIVQVIPAE